MKQIIEFLLNVFETWVKNFHKFLENKTSVVVLFSSQNSYIGSSLLYMYALIHKHNCTIETRLSVFCNDLVHIFSKSNSCFPDLNILSISHLLRYFSTTFSLSIFDITLSGLSCYLRCFTNM